MYYFYILYSLEDNRLYKGSCEDFPKRFIRHNSVGNKSTAHRKPFILIHIEIYKEKKPALVRERFLKSLEGSSELKRITEPITSLIKNTKLNLQVVGRSSRLQRRGGHRFERSDFTTEGSSPVC